MRFKEYSVRARISIQAPLLIASIAVIFGGFEDMEDEYKFIERSTPQILIQRLLTIPSVDALLCLLRFIRVKLIDNFP